MTLSWPIETAIVAILAALAGTQGDPLDAPRQRCLAAVEAVPELADLPLEETMALDIGGGHFLLQHQTPDGTVLSCQLCEQREDTTCTDDGLRLAARPDGGELRDLPAELDRKCLAALRRELVRDWSPRSDQPDPVALDPVAGFEVDASHTDTRFVYRLLRDADEYRCVIRRSDGSYRLEEKRSDQWDALAVGRMF